MTDLTAGPGFRHLAFFYRTRGEYQAALTQFVVDALERGEPTLIAIPGERGDALWSALPTTAGRAVFADMAELGRNPSGIIPAISSFLERHRGKRVSYLGEPVWPGRSDSELAEAAKHEALVNLAFAGTEATILCSYDRRQLPAGVLADARRTHPEVLERGNCRRSGDYLGPGHLPPRCERPPSAPPESAEELIYSTDLRPLRALVADSAQRAGLTQARSADLVLAVSEVAANTLRHTPGSGRLRVWQERGEILCQIDDGGFISDPLAGRRPPGEYLDAHQGLWVVNQVCDLVEIRTGEEGTTVRMHMSLSSVAR